MGETIAKISDAMQDLFIGHPICVHIISASQAAAGLFGSPTSGWRVYEAIKCSSVATFVVGEWPDWHGTQLSQSTHFSSHEHLCAFSTCEIRTLYAPWTLIVWPFLMLGHSFFFSASRLICLYSHLSIFSQTQNLCHFMTRSWFTNTWLYISWVNILYFPDSLGNVQHSSPRQCGPWDVVNYS